MALVSLLPNLVDAVWGADKPDAPACKSLPAPLSLQGKIAPRPKWKIPILKCIFSIRTWSETDKLIRCPLL